LASTFDIQFANKYNEIKNVTVIELELIETTNRVFKYHIEFANPKEVSSYEIDKVRIRFTNSFLVSSLKDGQKLIPNWNTNYHDIPP